MPEHPNKRVLIITYYWPPAGGPGVQRVLKFVKYLPQFGWEPIVLTVKDGEYNSSDTETEYSFLKDVHVYKTITFEPFILYKSLMGLKNDEKLNAHIILKKNKSIKDKFFQYIRANFFIPDARIGWYLPAILKGIHITRKEKPDIIFSSAPPHTVQLIAKRLSKFTGIKWVTDIRDPWTDAFWDKELTRNIISRKVNLWLEKSCYKSAYHIITVSEGLKEFIKLKSRSSITVINNGFDPDDFKSFNIKSNLFRIKYLGSIGDSQVPINLLKYLSNLNESIISNISINLYGNIDNEFRHQIVQLNLDKVISINSFLPHKEFIEQIINSEILLYLLPNQGSKGVLTYKLFEYLATDNFILGIGDELSEAAEIITNTHSGLMIDFNKTSFNIIEKLYEKWNKGIPLKKPNIGCEVYNRKDQVKQLSGIFNQVLEQQSQKES